MKTKVTIPITAYRHCLDKIRTATAASTHHDSVGTKIVALNRIIGRWCRYYQYTGRASTQFATLDYHIFWSMAHWLGRKCRLPMPQVMRTYYQGKTFTSGTSTLIPATVYKTKHYAKHFIKPNSYTTQLKALPREELPTETYWTGYERRPGTWDLRPIILERDGYTCQRCGTKGLTLSLSHLDHKRPTRKFKLPVNANSPENLQTLCIP